LIGKDGNHAGHYIGKWTKKKKLKPKRWCRLKRKKQVEENSGEEGDTARSFLTKKDDSSGPDVL